MGSSRHNRTKRSLRSREKIGWQAKAPAPRGCKSFGGKVGQTLSSVGPTIRASFSRLPAVAAPLRIPSRAQRAPRQGAVQAGWRGGWSTSPMIRLPRQRGARRGGTIIESALVLLVYAVLMAGVMELGVIGFAVNSVSFAAHRAARFASLRGNGSGHPATAADIQASATGYAAPLSGEALTVAVTWTPDNHPGSTVQVKVSYNFKPAMLPVSAGALTLQTTAREMIAQ